MKLNIKNLVFLVTTVAVTGISCKKQDFNNTNPDSVTGATVDYKTVLPASMTATATIIEGTSFKFLQNWMGWWARSGSYQDVTDEESYVFDNDFNVGIWNGLYTNATNYNFVIGKAQASGAGFYEAIGRIMKSLDFQMLVDVYGNVPYSQAFQGVEGRTPAYDKGQDIYDSLFVDIDRAIALLKDPAATSIDLNGNIGVNDLVYKGNAAKWIKFANTLKLRMIVHAYQAPGFDIAGKVAVIEAEGSGYLNAGETASINPGYTSSKPNPFWRANVLTEAGAATGNGSIERANAYAVGPNPPATTAGYYSWNGDPREDKFYTPPSSGTQRGIYYGLLAPPASANLSGDKLSTIDGPGYNPNGASTNAWIITDFESLFLQAEAKQRNITTAGPSAAELLHSAESANFNYLGLNGTITVTFPIPVPPAPQPTPASDLDAYLIINAGYPDIDYEDGSLGTGTDGLYTILSQKWFAMNGFNSLEVWTDWRRTGVEYGTGSGFLPGPPLSVNPARPTGKGIPIRLFYPQNEYNYNAVNVAAQGTIVVDATATAATGRIFWDIN